MHGKDAVVSAAKNFGGILQDIQIRSRFAAGNQIQRQINTLFHLEQVCFASCDNYSESYRKSIRSHKFFFKKMQLAFFV